MEQMVTHVFRCLMTTFREVGKRPIKYLQFVLVLRVQGLMCIRVQIQGLEDPQWFMQKGKEREEEKRNECKSWPASLGM